MSKTCVLRSFDSSALDDVFPNSSNTTTSSNITTRSVEEDRDGMVDDYDDDIIMEKTYSYNPSSLQSSLSSLPSTNLERFFKLKYYANANNDHHDSTEYSKPSRQQQEEDDDEEQELSKKASVLSIFSTTDDDTAANDTSAATTSLSSPSTRAIFTSSAATTTRTTSEEDPPSCYVINDEMRLPVNRIRSLVQRILETRIRVLCRQSTSTTTTSTNNTDQQQQWVTKTAMDIETLLFQNASSLKVYSDLTTLDERMRQLYFQKLYSQRKKQLRSTVSKRHRQRLLQDPNLLGQDRYQELVMLVQEIKEERMSLAASLCAKCTTNGTCSFNNKRLLLEHGSSTLPLAVRNLFFQDGLEHAIERIPLNRIHTVDWDTLQRRGQEHLNAFRKWKANKLT